MELCPHCGGTTTSEESRALRWVCGACGGARVPGVKMGREAVALLARAKSERTKHRSATLVAVVLVGLALFLAAIALVAAATGNGLPALGAAAIAAIDFTMAMAALAYAKKRAFASRDALDTAWASAAVQLARKRGGQITARDLSAALKTSDADADAILAKLSAGGASVEVDDDAELHYRVDSAVAPQSEHQPDTSETAKHEASR